MRCVLVCAHSHAVVVYLSMCSTCACVNVKVCAPPSTDSLPRSPATMLELLDQLSSVWCVRLLVPFGLVLQGPPLGDIKSRGEVEAGCSDMLKCWLRGDGPRKGGRSWSTVLGAWQRCLGWRQLGALAVTAGSTVSVLCPCSVVPSTGGGAGDGLVLPCPYIRCPSLS